MIGQCKLKLTKININIFNYVVFGWRILVKRMWKSLYRESQTTRSSGRRQFRITKASLDSTAGHRDSVGLK